MDWKEWQGKKVFLKLQDGGVYSGKIIEVDDSKPPLVWIILIDKYGNKVTVVHSQIIKIVDESTGGKNGKNEYVVK